MKTIRDQEKDSLEILQQIRMQLAKKLLKIENK